MLLQSCVFSRYSHTIVDLDYNQSLLSVVVFIDGQGTGYSLEFGSSSQSVLDSFRISSASSFDRIADQLRCVITQSVECIGFYAVLSLVSFDESGNGFVFVQRRVVVGIVNVMQSICASQFSQNRRVKSVSTQDRAFNTQSSSLLDDQTNFLVVARQPDSVKFLTSQAGQNCIEVGVASCVSFSSNDFSAQFFESSTEASRQTFSIVRGLVLNDSYLSSAQILGSVVSHCNTLEVIGEADTESVFLGISGSYVISGSRTGDYGDTIFQCDGQFSLEVTGSSRSDYGTNAFFSHQSGSYGNNFSSIGLVVDGNHFYLLT